MVRITPELIEHALQFTNAIRDRELDLRGYKMPAIENLGTTFDQFDTIDFTDNEVRRLEGFPLLKRLRSLILTDNKIIRIGPELHESVPNLETIILTANSISELKDLDPLGSCSKLTFLSLLHNPVTLKPNYRLYVIGRIPTLRFLDYKRVTYTERKQSKSYMKHAFLNKKPENANVKTFVPGEPVATNGTATANESNGVTTEGTDSAEAPSLKRPAGATNQDLFAIQDAIKKAKTLSEVERLQHLLGSGQFAGFAAKYGR